MEGNRRFPPTSRDSRSTHPNEGSMWIMNPAISCIADTLRLLLEETKRPKETAAAKRGSAAEGFEIVRSEALAEDLQIWANQLRTFGLDSQLNGMWEGLRVFLASQGY